MLRQVAALTMARTHTLYKGPCGMDKQGIDQCINLLSRALARAAPNYLPTINGLAPQHITDFIPLQSGEATFVFKVSIKKPQGFITV